MKPPPPRPMTQEDSGSSVPWSVSPGPRVSKWGVTVCATCPSSHRLASDLLVTQGGPLLPSSLPATPRCGAGEAVPHPTHAFTVLSIHRVPSMTVAHSGDMGWAPAHR